MQQSIRKSTGLDSQVIKGSGGVFDVRLDDDLVYSHFQTGRFPQGEEIVAEIRRRQKR